MHYQKIAMGVGTDSHEGGMPQTGQPGESDRDHQSQPGNGVDKNEGHFTNIKLVQDSRCRQYGRRQQTVPENIPAMLEELYVLKIRCFKYDPHEGNLTD